MLKGKRLFVEKTDFFFLEYVYPSRKKMLQEKLSGKSRKMIFRRAMHTFSWKTFVEKDYYTSGTRH